MKKQYLIIWLILLLIVSIGFNVSNFNNKQDVDYFTRKVKCNQVAVDKWFKMSEGMIFYSSKMFSCLIFPYIEDSDSYSIFDLLENTSIHETIDKQEHLDKIEELR